MPYEKLMGTGDEASYIYRIADGAWIPFDEANADYIEFEQYLIDNDLDLADIPDYTPPA